MSLKLKVVNFLLSTNSVDEIKKQNSATGIESIVTLT